MLPLSLKKPHLSWIKTIASECTDLASKRSKQLQFAGLLFLMIGLVFYRWYGFTQPFYLRIACLGIMAMGWLLLPQLLYPILWFWFFIGKVVGEFVSFILLSLLYFLFIWIAKLFVKVDLKPGWKPKNGDRDYSSMG